MTESTDRYVVAPVLKALRTLDVVAASGEGASLAALAPQLRLPKTTLFRYLQTLVAADYLDHDAASDTYRVGIRFRALHAPPPALERLRQAALPEMERLRAVFDETVNLGVQQGGEIVYAEVVESQRRLRIRAKVGSRDPLHSTALGKAILSRLPDAERRALLQARLGRRTGRTVVQPDALAAELVAAAHAGYATETGENEEGATCVAVALSKAFGVAAAISLSAPESRLPRDRLPQVGRAVMEAASRIGSQAQAA